MRRRKDAAPPGGEQQVLALKSNPGVDNPYAVAWAAYSKDGSVQNAYDGSTCPICKQTVPMKDGKVSAHLCTDGPVGHGKNTSRGDEDSLGKASLCAGSGGDVYGDVSPHKGGTWVVLDRVAGKVIGEYPSMDEAQTACAGRKDDGVSRVMRFDFAPLRAAKRTPEGYLKVDARIARVGVQEYRDGTGRVVRELRLPEEVFDEESLASFRQVPVTNGHPPEMLTAENAKKYAVGATGEDVRRDGDYVAAPMLVFDAGAIKDAEGGRSQVSNGYSCTLDETYDEDLDKRWGKYDAIQRRIRGNHVAIVDVARAGPEARMRLDSSDAVAIEFDKPAGRPLGSEKEGKEISPMHTLKVDGFSFEVNDPNAQAAVDRAIAAARKDEAEKALSEKTKAENADKLRGEAQKALSELQAKHDSLVEKSKSDGSSMIKVDGAEISIADLGDAVKRESFLRGAISKATKVRASLLAEARRHLGANENMDEVEDLEIKKKVIAKLRPEAKLDGRDAVYVEARYDAAIEDAKVSPVVRVREEVVRSTTSTSAGPREDEAPSDDPDAARRAMITRELRSNPRNGARH